MTENDKQKILDWLEEKLHKGKINCEICATCKWIFSEDITTPTIILQNNKITIGGRAYPQIMAICSTCGNTKYFNTALIIHKGTEN